MINSIKEVSVRLASLEDKDIVLNWRNDTISRQMSFETELVSTEKHQKWFNQAINSLDKILILCYFEETNQNIGVVRFDIKGERAQVSINLAPEMRGRGLSRECLLQSINFFKFYNNDIIFLDAKIKKINNKSIRAFYSLGFREVKSDVCVSYFQYKFK